MKIVYYAFAFWFYSFLMYGCGSAGQSSPKQLAGGPTSSPVIAVQLNDMWNQVFPSESVELTDARYFTPPSAITAVGGSYGGSNPGQYLHARIVIGSEQCEYQANGINETVFSLQFCSGGVGSNTYLPAGTQIELVNYDAPGILIEAHFNLTR
jgi:hypothetical protein